MLVAVAVAAAAVLLLRAAPEAAVLAEGKEAVPVCRAPMDLAAVAAGRGAALSLSLAAMAAMAA